MTLTESMVEAAALEWFGELGYSCLGAEALNPAHGQGERESYGDVVLVGRLREAIRRLNPTIPEEAREEAVRKVLRVGTPSLTQTNRAFHRMLRDGVDVEYPRADGSIKGDKVVLVGFGDVRANDWLVVNQFTVVEGQHDRRADIVVFVNGLPLGLIELKNAADEDATIWSAYAQLQTYKAEIPSLLAYNAALVVSDGLQARMGSITANRNGSRSGARSMARETPRRRRWSWRCWCAACSSGSGSWTSCTISSSSRKTRTRAHCTRSSRATISSTR